MFAGLIVMAILGCGDDGDACQRVGTAKATYASTAECNAAAEAELQKISGIAYPVIAVRCEPAPRIQVAAAR